jgi:hypothetical protein
MQVSRPRNSLRPMQHHQAGFRKGGNRVQLGGTIIGHGTEIKVFRLPADHRPPREMHFTVEAEQGETVVTVGPDGWVLASPSQGWVKLDGIEFTIGP